MTVDTVRDLDRAAERVPASAMMEALWWLHHRAKNQSVYNLTWRMSCDRPLDRPALAAAWQAVAERHEAMRGSLHQGDGRILLEVADSVELPLQWVDVDDPGDVPADDLLRLIAEEVQERPIALDTAPLARVTAVRVGDRHELLLTIHHAVVDGWGVQRLVGELSEAYATATGGGTLTFDGEPVSLREYVRDAEAARTDGRWAASIDYWRKTLDGAATTTLIADHGRTIGAGGAGAMVRFEVSPEAAEAVTTLSKQYFTTPFVVFLASLQAALALGGNGPDVCTGVATANRMTEREQGLVGYVANLVLARTQVSAEDTFGAVVERTRDTVWGMLAHQTVPFSLVFGALDPEAQLRLRDAIPIILTHLGPIGNGLTLGDVRMRMLRAPNRAARTDLGIGVLDVDGGYLLDCEYATGRYDRQTPLRLLHDMDTVLAAGGADPGVRLSTLDISSKSGPAHVDHAPAAPTGGPTGTSALPRSAAMDEVRRAWTDVLGTEPAGPDEDFFATGGRSLKVVQLMSAIEEATGVRLDVPRWLTDPTPQRAAEQVAGGLGSGADTTVVEVRGGDGPHVHLIPGAGGSAQDYRALIAALPGHWRVTQSQERGPLPDVPAMAAAFQADLDAADARPDLLVGWSMGGQIAYEMAARLGAAAPPVAVLDATPPLGYEVGEEGDELVHTTFAGLMAAAVGARLDGGPARTSPGDPELAMRALAAQLTAATGERVSSVMLTERWATFRRHTAAVASYVSDADVPAPALVVGADLADYQLEQWAERFSAAPDVLRVDADHHGTLREPAASHIAAAIVRLQERAAAR
ncbi:condensation protein [Dactylosporangium roseum]|uniref:Condensation protein n=1 Tax=Dactylosporangium roseum TaxID=47989 RepID=A0ABY5ZF52_9ACTN|nr:condensation domain-containing protein [Dactylosporangium roseum]UWZ39583.1 condensation protein [Dactylosporangium roseum]